MTGDSANTGTRSAATLGLTVPPIGAEPGQPPATIASPSVDGEKRKGDVLDVSDADEIGAATHQQSPDRSSRREATFPLSVPPRSAEPATSVTCREPPHIPVRGMTTTVKPAQQSESTAGTQRFDRPREHPRRRPRAPAGTRVAPLGIVHADPGPPSIVIGTWTYGGDAIVRSGGSKITRPRDRDEAAYFGHLCSDPASVPPADLPGLPGQREVLGVPRNRLPRP